MPWIPESQRTSVWYLLEPKFLVRVPQMAQRSVDDIKLFGTPTSTDENVDREMAKNLNTCMLSIAAMEEMFHRGHDVKVINYNDTEKIYRYVTDHLVAFKNLFMTSENINPEPEFVDELIRLDRFAAAVYGKAKYVIGEDIKHSILTRRLRSGGGLSKLSRNTVLTRTAPKVEEPEVTVSTMRDYGTNVEPSKASLMPIEPTDDPRYPQRISLETMFERHKRLGDTRWK